jgi:hypothetical protein
MEGVSVNMISLLSSGLPEEDDTPPESQAPEERKILWYTLNARGGKWETVETGRQVDRQ